MVNSFVLHLKIMAIVIKTIKSSARENAKSNVICIGNFNDISMIYVNPNMELLRVRNN